MIFSELMIGLLRFFSLFSFLNGAQAFIIADRFLRNHLPGECSPVYKKELFPKISGKALLRQKNQISGISTSTSWPTAADLTMWSMMAWLYRIWLVGTGAAV